MSFSVEKCRRMAYDESRFLLGNGESKKMSGKEKKAKNEHARKSRMDLQVFSNSRRSGKTEMRSREERIKNGKPTGNPPGR